MNLARIRNRRRRWSLRTTSSPTYTPRHVSALGLIADTFIPAAGGVPSATDVAAPDFALELASRNPRTADRRQLQLLLQLWDTRLLGTVLWGSPRRFSGLSVPQREQRLLSLADSRIAAKRTLFTALKTASSVPYYADCGDAGWAHTGYPGPLGILPAAQTTAPLRMSHIASDAELVCDVVVIGSGAGGGTAAAVLAGSGLDVVVLEAGGYYDERDYDGGERMGLVKLYSPAPQTSADGQIILVAGSAVGGGTVVNWTTSFRTPDRVRTEWASHGARQFASTEYEAALDAVCNRLNVNTEHSSASSRDAALERGARALGWDVAAMPRNVTGCDQGIECGRCGMGCRIGAKQSAAKTWLADAVKAGARIFPDTKVLRVTTSSGVADGVEAVCAGRRIKVRARAVVVAAGGIQTPALLQRSGLTNPNIGRHLRLHPGTAVWGVFDEAIDPWVGAMQNRYVTRLTDLDGDGYGVLLETGPLTPGFGSNFINWRGGTAFRQRMSQLRNLTGIAVILRDRDSTGTVRLGRDGEPIVKYRLSPHDSEHIQRGLEGAARLMEAAGARQIYSAHTRTVQYRPGVDGDLARFSAACRHEGTDAGRIAMASLHIMGSARMGGSPETSAVNPDGQAWEMPGLYVADGSCFPTASGVNPMISIEAIAYMTASRLAAKLA